MISAESKKQVEDASRPDLEQDALRKSRSETCNLLQTSGKPTEARAEVREMEQRTESMGKLLDSFAGLKPGEKVLILNDPAGMDAKIPEILRGALEKRGIEFKEVMVSDQETDPDAFFPLLEECNFIWSSWGMDSAKVNFDEFVDKIEELKIRMAYVPGLRVDSLDEGGALTEDRDELVHRLDKMEARLRECAGLRVRTGYGTDLRIGLKKGERRWQKEVGDIKPREWDNLPGGEIMTTPDEENVNGVLVLPVLQGDIDPHQGVDEVVVLKIRGGKIATIDGGKSAETLRRHLEAASGNDKNPLSVLQCAEIAFGANSKARNKVSNPGGHYTEMAIPTLEAEKRLGTIHIAFGSSQLGEEGVRGHNESNLHRDFVIPNETLSVVGFRSIEDFKSDRNGIRLIDQGNMGGLLG